MTSRNRMASKSTATENVLDNSKMHFGKFKVRLAELLTTDIILSLATLFVFPPAKIDELRPAKSYPGQLMVSLMEERGKIKPNDISPLLTALDKLGLHPLLSTLQDIFPRCKDFGRFKVQLAEHLTTDIIVSLATFFVFPPAKIDNLQHVKNIPGHLMVSLMEERGKIKPNDISPLLTALDELGLHGLQSTLYRMHRIIPGSEDKTCLFLRYLKTFYKQLYSKIHPIPYIREKMYCVNEVFVEGGIEMHIRDSKNTERSLKSNKMEAVKLKSYRDIFNDDIISSKRILLEGDPGYGKSTFTLQAAYDWCTASDTSPLKDVAIFILLPLRLLGGILSICLAIKLLLMPGESKLSEEDIMEILLNSPSVVLILDGYDEYPDKEIFDQSEIMKIIAGNMFANFKVITCTRSAYLPNNLDVETVKVCLTGFDDNARDEYIRRAVAVNDNQAARRINDLLTRSPVLSDICQVPLFCVMFVHISNEEESMVSFASVTIFVRYILTCFYEHMWNREGRNRKPNDRSIIPDYPKLYRLLFDSLTGKNQQIVWQKDKFKTNVGNGCYNELITIGILIEEDILKKNDKPNMATVSVIQRTTVVRFYHKLFAEWYAANYLARYAGSFFPFWLRSTLKNINPVDLQFVFRFACGLNEKASSRIIKYLKGMEDGQSFASLCFIEQVGKADEVVAMVKDLCTGGVTISSTDSKLLQRSTIQILDIAAKGDIPITSLYLNKSFKECEEDVFVLHSGLRLNRILTVEKIHIETAKVNDEPRILTKEEVTMILRYGLRSEHLKELLLAGCVLPLSFSSESLHIGMNSRDIKVCWSLLDREVLLNVQSGQWEVEEKDSLRQLCSVNVVIDDRDNYLQQCITIISVQTASYHDIPITSVHLNKSFKHCEEDVIVLHSGLRLNQLLTVEKVHIEAEEVNNEPRILTVEDVTMLIRYGLRSEHFKELSFNQFQLPTSVSPEAFTDKMKTQNIQVRWCPFDIHFHLDLETGHWEVDNNDTDTLSQLCSDTVHIRNSDDIFKQKYTIMFIHTASIHEIPISCLYLRESFRKIDSGDVILHSGLNFSCPVSVKKVVIFTEEGREMTETEVVDILIFVQQSHMLEKLEFDGCLLPPSFFSKSIPAELKSRDIKVFWNNYGYCLNLQSGLWEVYDVDTVRKLCTGMLEMHIGDSKLLQRCTIKLLENASFYDIPISCLSLRLTFTKIDAGEVILHSGLRLSCPVSVKKVVIQTLTGREVTETEVVDILVFLQQSHMLEKLEFEGCLLPLAFSSDSIPAEMQSRDIKVFWNNYGYSLNLQSGVWELDDVDKVKRLCTWEVNIDCNNSELLQRCTLKLLENASYHDIPIFCLYLDKSFSKIDAGDVILHSGLRLSCPISLKKVVINTMNEGREMTETEVVDILMFVQQSHLLEKLEFDGCLLPSISSSEAVLAEFKTRDIKVLWMSCGYSLNFQSGAWEVDVDSVKRICTKTVFIASNDSDSIQRCTIQLLENASDYDIPITCLYLKKTFSYIDAGNIILETKLHLPCPVSVKKVVIATERGRAITETEVINIFMFVQQSHMLEELEFDGCVLPFTFSSESIPAELQSRNIKVFWSNYGYSLDLQSGIWKVNEDVVRKICTREKFIRLDDSELLQRCTIQFLENASNYDIPISCLYLYKSYCKIDAGDVILHSGLRLSCPVLVKELVIETERRREMRETEVVDILMFVQRSHMLKELKFFGCVLPQYIPTESVPSKLKSRNVKVSWGPSCFLLYTMNLQSGRWMDCETRQEITDTEYTDEGRESRDKMMWEKLAHALGLA